MKNLYSYIVETANEQDSLCKGILNEEYTFESVCDDILNEMLSINEGFFSKLGNKLKEWGNKAAEKGESIDAKIKALSDSGKKIIDNAKTKAGNAWNTIKDAYVSIVSSLDNALNKLSDKINAISSSVGVSYEKVQGTISAVFANAIAKGGETADAIKGYIDDKSKGAQKLTALSILILGAQLSVKCGIDSSTALELLSEAGFK